MNAFKQWFKTKQSRSNNKNETERMEEEKIQEYQYEYKKEFMKNKELYEQTIDKATNNGLTNTKNIERQCHIMGVHTADIDRMGPKVYNEELKKRQETTFRCEALQRMVKDINRHENFGTRLIYEGEINYSNMIDNSIVDCKVFFDWTLKNNLKFMKDKVVGKVV